MKNNSIVKAICALVVVPGVVLFAASEAKAVPSFCNAFHMNWYSPLGGGLPATRKLIIGQWIDGGGTYQPALAACEEDAVTGLNRTFRLLGDPATFTSCGSWSTPPVVLGVWGTPGDDLIGPLKGATPADCTVGLAVNGIGPLPVSWNIGLYALGQDGNDRIYGTENADYLYSYVDQTPFSWLEDVANDTLCGFGGSDTLTGDGDDDADATIGGHHECMDGGGGADVCDGNEAIPSTVGDDWNACTTAKAAHPGNCDCAPAADFWWKY